MSVQQISVFLESQPGHLRRVLDAFEDAHVSVRGYSASDTGDYGIVRFIVDDPERAHGRARGHGRRRHDDRRAVRCALNDEPGELARVMGVMADCGINVDVQLLAHLHLHRAVREGPRARRSSCWRASRWSSSGQDDLARSLGPDGLAAACGEGR